MCSPIIIRLLFFFLSLTDENVIDVFVSVWLCCDNNMAHALLFYLFILCGINTKKDAHKCTIVARSSSTQSCPVIVHVCVCVCVLVLRFNALQNTHHIHIQNCIRYHVKKMAITICCIIAMHESLGR